MNVKKLFLLAVIPILSLTAYAQNSRDYTPKKGDFTVAATVGYNSYTNISAMSGLLNDYEATALSTNWTEQKLMIGVEGGWFFKDLWKLNLGGGLNFTNNPGYTSVPGTIDGDSETGDGSIPNYRAIADAYSLNYSVFVEVDKYFKSAKVTNLMFYTGIKVGFAYGVNEMKYDEPEVLGKSVAETSNVRAAFTAGVEYYLCPALYVGCQVDPITYTYNMTSYKPQEGLASLSADSHNFGFLAAPTLKIGFKF